MASNDYRQQMLNEMSNQTRALKRQARAQEEANALKAGEIAVQQELAENAKEYYKKQIEIDSQLLSIENERIEKERSEIFCNWCGRRMPEEQATEYLDIKTCSLNCKNSYRKHLIEEQRLIFCDICGADLIEELVVRDYVHVEIDEVVMDDGTKEPFYLGDIWYVSSVEDIMHTTALLDKLQSCSYKCLAKYLKKDEKFVENYQSLKGQLKDIIATYNKACQLTMNYLFEDALIIFEQLNEFREAAKYTVGCKKSIERYAEIIKSYREKLQPIEDTLKELKDTSRSVAKNKKIAKEKIKELKNINKSFFKEISQDELKYSPLGKLAADMDELQKQYQEIAEISDWGCLYWLIIIFMVMIVVFAIGSVIQSN